MSLDQHAADLGVGLTGAWAAEGFVPATYRHVSGTAPASTTQGLPLQRGSDEGDGSADDCVILRLPTRPDASGSESGPGAWVDAPPWRRGPQRGRRGGWTR